LAEHFGRYVVLETAGVGGMSRVLRAYDPMLQREVALKIVRTDRSGPDTKARMLREARAMARLSHPNVVPLHDAEATAEGIVLVMEYVGGQTLRQWIKADAPSWGKIVDQFAKAGRGLAAAHAQGLLHRDFKPGNVLVAESGEVKVTDFGLAKQAGSADLQSASIPNDSFPDDSLDATLTLAGRIVGTPRYMAPEQHVAGQLTEAVDQYSFCVALWSALVGRPPFQPRDSRDLLAAKLRGPPEWPANAPAVPKRIVEAIRRGLSVDPAERWPTMAKLNAELSPEPAWRGRRGLAIVGGVAVLGVGGIAMRYGSEARPTPCRGAAAELQGVWDQQTRRAAKKAFDDTSVTFARDAWIQQGPRIDAYADAWIAMHTETCEATTTRGVQSAALMDLRMACLRRAKVELGAAAAVLQAADADVVKNAHAVADGLRPLSRCEDVEALRADIEAPAEDEAEAVQALRSDLAAAKALTQGGRYNDAQLALDRAATTLEGVSYPPARTEVALRRGTIAYRLGNYDAAAEALHETLREGTEHRQPAEVLEAMTTLFIVVGIRQHRPQEALAYRSLAHGLAAGNPRAEAEVHNAVAGVLKTQARLDDAVVELEQAVALNREALGQGHPAVAASLSNLGAVRMAQGRYADAEALTREAVALWEAALGVDHPKLANSLNRLGNVLGRRGEFAEASAAYRRALSILEDGLGPDHPDIAAILNNLGTTVLSQGDAAEAERLFERALAGHSSRLGPTHPETAKTRRNVASALGHQGDFEAALSGHRAALKTWKATLSPGHSLLVTGHTDVGATLTSLGRYAEAEAMLRQAIAVAGIDRVEPQTVALAHTALARALEYRGKHAAAQAEHRQALALTEKALGSAAPQLIGLRANVAGALQAQGKTAEAEAEYRKALAAAADDPIALEVGVGLAALLLTKGELEEALALAEQSQKRQGENTSPQRRAEAAFVLARIVWEAAKAEPATARAAHRMRARELAGKASSVLQAAKHGRRDHERAAVDAWLDAHK